MKKRLLSLLLVLVLSMSLCVAASAATYIPDDVTYQNVNGRQLIVKIYTLLPDQDPNDIIEDDFEYDGYIYTYSDIVKSEQTYNEQTQHKETVTIETESKNLEDILAALEPTIDFDDGTSKGTLALDHNSLKTEAAGYSSSSYTVTATKNYTGLDRNDSSYIDKTVTKDGRTLSLSNVTWSVESTTLVGDELIPATYAAVATYSGTAYTSKATGYITTADYIGTVTSSGVSSIRYTVTYIGTLIETEPDLTKDLTEEPTEEPAEEQKSNLLPIVAGCSAIVMALLLLFLTLFRKNITVYEATGKGNEYDKCGRLHLNEKKPDIRLDRLKKMPEGMIAIEIDEKAAKQMFGKTIDIHYYDASFQHTVGTANGPYWFKLDVGEAVDEEYSEEDT
jgi:hypothetical protein